LQDNFLSLQQHGARGRERGKDEDEDEDQARGRTRTRTIVIVTVIDRDPVLFQRPSSLRSLQARLPETLTAAAGGRRTPPSS